MALGKAVVNIQANLAPLKRGLAKARLLITTSLRGFASGVLGGIATIVRRTMSAITTAVRRIVIAVSAAMVAIGFVSVKAASDMTEANNLFAVSFGNLTDEMEEWTKSFADSLKLNQTNIKGFVGTFNLMLTGMGIGAEEAAKMSKRLTELTIDLASLRNLKFEEAFTKIAAGITGETEPLKRLGILLDENTVKTQAVADGIARQGEELTGLQKVQARFNALLRQTRKDTGDFANTMDEGNNIFKTFAEQVKNVREEIGLALLPTVSRITLAMRNWLFENRKQIGEWATVFVDKIEGAIAVVKPEILTFIEIAKMDGLASAIGEQIGFAVKKIKEVFNENKPELISFMTDLGASLSKALAKGIAEAFKANFKLQFTGPLAIRDIISAEAEAQRLRGVAGQRGVQLQPALPFTRGPQRKVGGL